MFKTHKKDKKSKKKSYWWEMKLGITKATEFNPEITYNLVIWKAKDSITIQTDSSIN